MLKGNLLIYVKWLIQFKKKKLNIKIVLIFFYKMQNNFEIFKIVFTGNFAIENFSNFIIY